jgi:quercetin dioxygenase-like cupin family protein
MILSGAMDFADLATAEAVEMRPGIVRRTLVHRDLMVMVHWRIGRDVWFGEHAHPYEQLGYVLRGSLEIFVGGRKHHLRAGSSYAIASGVLHDAHSLEDCEVLDVFSPVRREYLPGDGTEG